MSSEALNHLYFTYIKVYRRFGVFPFIFKTNHDPTSPNSSIVSVSTARSTRQRAFCAFNLTYVILVGISKISLLLYHHATDHQYETMRNGYLITSLWLTGAVIVLTILATVLWYQKYIAEILTSSFRLESYVYASMQPEVSALKLKRRVQIFKFQLMIYISALTFTPFILIPINIYLPRFSPFLNSLLLKPDPSSYGYFDPPADAADSSSILTVFIYWTLNKALKYALFFHEVYFAFLCWAIFGSFDILLNVIFSIIARTIDQTQVLIKTPGTNGADCINLYNGLRAHVTKIDNTFGVILFAQEMLNLLLNTLVVYAALVSENIMLIVFFVFNSFTVTLRMYFFYLPISSMYLKSIKFIKTVKKRSQNAAAALGSQQDQESIVKGKKLAILRHLVLRPVGLHRITPSSISDYVLAVFSYLIVVIET